MAMMDVPLNAWLLFGHTSRHFAGTEVITRRELGDIHRVLHTLNLRLPPAELGWIIEDAGPGDLRRRRPAAAP
jgi:hypothetical protein